MSILSSVANFVEEMGLPVKARGASSAGSVPPESAVVGDGSAIGGLSSIYNDSGIAISEYKEMVEREPQMKAVVDLKIMARISSGWTIEAASEDPLDEEIAEFVRDQIDAMDGTLSTVLRKSMLAMAYKLSVLEVVYQYVEAGAWAGKIGLKAIKPKKAESFRVTIDDYGNVVSLDQQQGWNKWVPLDPNYFIFWAWDHDGDYRGKSDLRSAYRWYKAKDHLARFWNIFLERYAAPTPIAKHPSNASKTDIKKVVGFLANLHTKKAAAVPIGWEVEMLEAKREGGDYQGAIQYCDRMMARAGLMPQLILDEGESGSYSLGKSHGASFLWVLEYIGGLIEEDIIGEQLIKRLVKMNYQVDAFPKFKFKAFSSDNIEGLANALSRLVESGILDGDEPIVREVLGFPAQTYAAETPVPAGEGPRKVPTADEDPAEFAAGERPFTVDGLRHAKKADFRNMAKSLDALEATAMAEMAAAVKDMHKSLLKTVRSRRIVEDKDTAALDKLQINGTAVGSFRSALETGLGHGIHQGFHDGLAEVNRGLAKAGGRALQDLGSAAGNNFSDGELNFSMEEVIAFWDAKIPVQRALLREYSKRAFTISGDIRTTLLSRAKEAIRRGMTRSSTYAQIEQALNDIFEPYYLTEIDPIVGTSARLHNIVRTNMSEAYNTGRMNLYKHPDVADFVRAFEYSAVLDDRTTEFCRSWHGKVLKKDDPRWGQMLPPNHYQCRSVLIPVVQGEEYEVTANPPGTQPAPGFRL